MPTPYGLEIIQSCLTCTAREGSLFCDLARPAVTELAAIRQNSFYPAGAVLFVEGEASRGLYILCSGRAKLTATSPQGRSVIVRIANVGEVMGLSGTISNTTYVATAETLEPCQVNFLPRAEFHRFLRNHAEVAVRVAQHLSMELRRAYHQVCQVVLAPTARARLASLLLDYCARNGGGRFQLRLTHEEVGEIIGATRETVSRTLADFRKEGLLQIRGPHITIQRPEALQTLLP